jgi:hypothetical protein
MDRCDHTIGVDVVNSKITFVKESDLKYPHEIFKHCPACGAKISWFLLERRILFS